MGINWKVKPSVAFKVVAVYLIIVAGSLLLSGVLTNRAIARYVIATTRASLIADGQQVISVYTRAAAGTSGKKRLAAAGGRLLMPVLAQGVPVEYVVIDPGGRVLGGRFTNRDANLLRAAGGLIRAALAGRIETGLYPRDHPVFEFVALPFSYNANLPFYLPRVAALPEIRFPGGNPPYRMSTRVLALFARISDLQRITAHIWWAVVQGLAIAGAITALLGGILVRRMMRPIRTLREAVERVRERDFSSVPAIRTHDEWEDFAAAFGEMVVALKAFDEGQKRFLQNASHELKTPLMAIRGYAEGLRDGVFSQSEAFRILDVVAQESVRLKTLVDELIYLSKLETLDEVYTFMQCDLSSIIYKTIERVRPLAEERAVAVMPEVPAEPVRVLIDPDKMVQALMNLVANAIRHARERVRIALWVDGAAHLQVADDGEGLAPGHAERVFERFFHGAKGDTGLGLPIARAIVAKHRGSIEAENGPAGGAVFTVRLPPADRDGRVSARSDAT